MRIRRHRTPRFASRPPLRSSAASSVRGSCMAGVACTVHVPLPAVGKARPGRTILSGTARGVRALRSFVPARKCRVVTDRLSHLPFGDDCPAPVLFRRGTGRPSRTDRVRFRCCRAPRESRLDRPGTRTSHRHHIVATTAPIAHPRYHGAADRYEFITAVPGLYPCGQSAPVRLFSASRPILPWALPLPGLWPPSARVRQRGSRHPHRPSASGDRFRGPYPLLGFAPTSL